MKRKPVKDGLGNNVRDYIFNPAENRFEHKDELVHESSQPTLPGVFKSNAFSISSIEYRIVPPLLVPFFLLNTRNGIP